MNGAIEEPGTPWTSPETSLQMWMEEREGPKGVGGQSGGKRLSLSLCPHLHAHTYLLFFVCVHLPVYVHYHCCCVSREVSMLLNNLSECHLHYNVISEYALLKQVSFRKQRFLDTVSVPSADVC